MSQEERPLPSRGPGSYLNDKKKPDHWRAA